MAIYKTIILTDADLRKGKLGDSFSCPFSLSIKREFDARDVSVNTMFIRIYTGNEPIVIHTPKSIQDAIGLVDSRKRKQIKQRKYRLKIG